MPLLNSSGGRSNINMSVRRSARATYFLRFLPRPLISLSMHSLKDPEDIGTLPHLIDLDLMGSVATVR